MNIRGHVLPVVDYGILLGFSACQISDNTKVMILETRINGDLEQAGFVADEVLGIHTINPESFQSREKLVGREVHESITSISYWNEHSVMHMDIDLLFHSSKLSTE
jgi:chemotaxis signal transduction protein